MCIKIKIFHWSDILIYIFELYSKLFIIMNLKKVRIEPNRIKGQFAFDSNETNRKLGDSNSRLIRFDSNFTDSFGALYGGFLYGGITV